MLLAQWQAPAPTREETAQLVARLTPHAPLHLPDRQAQPARPVMAV